MPVVGRAHLHGVECVAELREHFAEVLKMRDTGEFLFRKIEPRSVDVAEADELHAPVRTDFTKV